MALSDEFELVFANRVAFVKSFRRIYRAGICIRAGFTLRSVVGAPVSTGTATSWDQNRVGASISKVTCFP